jgi:hypothetical protein
LDDTECRTCPRNQFVICENPGVREGKRAAKLGGPGANIQQLTDFADMQEIERQIDGQGRDIFYLENAA